MLPFDPIFHKLKKGSSKDWLLAVEIAELLKDRNETQQLDEELS
jgi:phenylalanine-4-hydroxylase